MATQKLSHFWNMTKTHGIFWGAKFRALAESPTGDHHPDFGTPKSAGQWAHLADHWFQYGPNYVDIPY